MLPSLSAFSIALLTVPAALFSLSWFSARAGHWQLLARPGGRHLHSRPVAVVGGFAVISCWALGVAVTAGLYPHWAATQSMSLGASMLGAFAILVLGLLDDRRGVPPKIRLVVELGVAAVTVFLEPQAHRFCLELAREFGPASFGLTAIGIVAVMNSMNLIDGLDGLAGSVFLSIAAVVSLLTGIATGNPGFAAVSSLMLIPGLVVFLRRNWNPAQTFMGDHGSLAVGYLLATASLSVQVDVGAGHSSCDLVALAMLFSYPMLDMVLCLFKRIRARQPLFVGDRNHMHHRMLRLGLSTGESAASLIAWQLAMLSPLALLSCVPARFAPLLLIPSCAVALERLLLLSRVEGVRLRELQKSSVASLYNEGGAGAGTEIHISLKPMFESVQYEERERLEQLIDTLRFFCERRIKGGGSVRVMADRLVVDLAQTSRTAGKPGAEELRRDWFEALDGFSRAFDLTYSTSFLPVEVRNAEAVGKTH